MNKIYFLIGASGSGKTTILKESKTILEKHFYLLHFDSIRVPTFNEMKKQYGSIEEWQKIKTFNRIKKIKIKYLSDLPVIFDAQTRRSFIKEGCGV